MTKLGFLFLGCVACWGEGPVPELPDGVDFVLAEAPPEECGTAKYIGDVAFVDGDLLALLYTWTEPSCGGGNTSGSRLPIDGRRVPLNGATASSFEPGMTQQGTASARVGGTAGRSVWANSPNAMDGTALIEVGGVPDLTASLNYSDSYYIPTGIVVDPLFGYVVATHGATNIDFNNPEWPCCGGSDMGNYKSKGWIIEWANPGTAIAPQLLDPATEAVYADSIKAGLVANTTHLFYPSRPTLTAATVIKSITKLSPGPGVERMTIPKADGMLVGLAATQSALYFAVTPSYVNFPIPGIGCTISRLDLANDAKAPLFTTTSYFCSDLALDDTHLYFTIVSAPEPDDKHGQNQPKATGIGLGRIELANPANVETVRTGSDKQQYSGARRVYMHQDLLYAVDPFLVVRIDKSKFAGQHDF